MADQLTFYQFRAGSIPVRFSNNKRSSNWIGRRLQTFVREFDARGVLQNGLVSQKDEYCVYTAAIAARARIPSLYC